MSFHVLCILMFILVNFVFHQSTCDLIPPLHRYDRPPFNYASNTPFLSEPDMESFIRNEWRDHPTTNISTLTTPLKEILYTAFNPNQTKIRVCSDLPLSTYKDKFSHIFQPSQVYVHTPSLVVPLKYFKWAFELMTILLNDDANSELRDAMIVAMNNLNALDRDGDSEMVKFMKNCQAVVVVPRLFKSNYCVIGPIIDLYFPALANVSLIQLGDTFLRYNSVNKLVKYAFDEYQNDTLSELEPIQVSEDDHISFESLRIIVDSFEKNLHSLYLKIEDDDTANDTSIPLSHWAIVYDALNTDVGQYLKLISSRNGSNEYENLPWIDYRQNTTNLAENDTMLSSSLKDFLSGNTTNGTDYCFGSRKGVLSRSVSENCSLEEISNSSSSDSSHDFVSMPISAPSPTSTFSDSVEKNDLSTDSGHPLVKGQNRISSHQRLHHHVGQTKNKNRCDKDRPPSPYNSCDLRILIGAPSRIGSSTLPKPYQTTANFEDTESKKNARNRSNKLTDLINDIILKTKNRNSKNSASDQLVSSVRKNDIQPTTVSFTDSTLIEELKNNFESSRTRVVN
ncbi:uncharacterized protein LOC135841957 isoform X1 [Planococcus citri]|uniref:uncharacterized protein LOC135841957 isoform X1 n=1 Tax=Planococcus citri TaxID=170843 RepID=UPI0031F93701